MGVGVSATLFYGAKVTDETFFTTKQEKFVLCTHPQEETFLFCPYCGRAKEERERVVRTSRFKSDFAELWMAPKEDTGSWSAVMKAARNYDGDVFTGLSLRCFDDVGWLLGVVLGRASSYKGLVTEFDYELLSRDVVPTEDLLQQFGLRGKLFLVAEFT